MQQQITISFVGDKQIKELLEKWASEDERSVSYILRKIIKKEARNRQHEEAKQ